MNWKPYSIPHSAMNLHQRTPDAEPPAVLWLIIGCKGKQFFLKNQIYSHLFLSSLLNTFELTAASYVALARKVRIRLRPIKDFMWTRQAKENQSFSTFLRRCKHEAHRIKLLQLPFCQF